MRFISFLGDSSREVNATSSEGSLWAAAGVAHESAAGTKQVTGLASQMKTASSTDFDDGASDSWGKGVESYDETTGEGLKDDSWIRAAGNLSCKDDSNGNKSDWNGFRASPEKQNMGWGNAGRSSDRPEATTWNKSSTVNEVWSNSWAGVKKDEGSTGGWGKKESTWDKTVEND
jgi:hypothetical protein